MNTRSAASVLTRASLGGLLLCMPLLSQATDSFTAISGANKPTHGKKTKPAKAPKPPARSAAGESPSERDKRLLRECRGKANAGACEGYAS